ncbi:MAG: DNA replication/repair protein RecF [Pseudomonadota bacterium]
MWIEKLTLTDFRNHAFAELATLAAPVVLHGPNGAGKTNILEAVSLLAPGQGLRRSAYPDIARQGGQGGWAVAARVRTGDETIAIGTGLLPDQTASGRGSRIVRIDGTPQTGNGVLADYVEMLWLTPTHDGLFTGPAGDRRRFLDRLVLCFDASHRTRANQFERAMRQRNRLLELEPRRTAELAGLERIMSETGVAIAAARRAALDTMRVTIEARRSRSPDSPFPWADIAIDGEIEAALETDAAIDVEDRYLERLTTMRDRDRAAGRTLAGPHRSDLVVRHGPKQMPARLCSTGEQKSLLVGLVLANAEMLTDRATAAGGHEQRNAPILLLDEIAAHLDINRRAALFSEIVAIGTQAWMTGTDRSAFESLAEIATFVEVGEDGIRQSGNSL